MNKELLKNGADMQDVQEETSYQQYKELGGIINEKDYDSALLRAKDTTDFDKTLISQAGNIAKIAGIKLHGTENSPDRRVVLYGILRMDVRPKGIKRHHDEMSDQRIFMEALRMLGDIDSIDKMVKQYPNISFKYVVSE